MPKSTKRPSRYLTLSTDAPEDPTFDVSKVAGNVPVPIKHHLGNPKAYLSAWVSPRFQDDPSYVFGRSIVHTFRVTEISVEKKKDEEAKLEGRVIVELEVTGEMINGAGTMHGGCSAFLVDFCSNLALAALTLTTEGKEYTSVSQAINMIYHSPADLGDTIRLVNTSMSIGRQVHSCRTEIWNATRHRLVASGTHVKMPAIATRAKL